MSDEQEDESLGVEQLPQTELDASPGKGEEQDPNTTGEVHGADSYSGDVSTTEAAKLALEQNRKNDD
jgi:hypothetical protein